MPQAGSIRREVQLATLGIIGGIAPPSTIDYYRQLTTRYAARSPDGHSPSILIDSIDKESFFRLLETDDRAAMVTTLVTELGRLARAGADVGLFASNTPHLVFDEVASQSPIPLISLVEEAAKVAESRGDRKLGLIGARFTMDGGFYETVFGRRGLSVVVPEADDREYVHERYFGELVNGVFTAETRAGISAVVDRMNARHDLDAVILGGTELPLLFRDSGLPGLPTLDTTSIHVDSAIDWLLGSA